MKPASLAFSLVACAMLLLCSCDTVTTSRPLTTTPKAIDKEKFEGTWIVNGGAIHVNFTDDGIAHTAWLEWKKDQFEMTRGELFMLEDEDDHFFSARFQENGKWEDKYFLAQYMFTDEGDLVIWMPKADIFAEAIKKNLLQGTVKKDKYSSNISITSDSKALLKFIKTSGNLKAFEYKEPIILKKAPSSEKNE